MGKYKDRADFSRVNGGPLPFGITVIPIPFSGRMNRNDGWQAYQIARLFEILITRITMDDAVISIIMHTHTRGSGKAGQCFHRVARARENFTVSREVVGNDTVGRRPKVYLTGRREHPVYD